MQTTGGEWEVHSVTSVSAPEHKNRQFSTKSTFLLEGSDILLKVMPVILNTLRRLSCLQSGYKLGGGGAVSILNMCQTCVLAHGAPSKQYKPVKPKIAKSAKPQSDALNSAQCGSNRLRAVIHVNHSSLCPPPSLPFEKKKVLSLSTMASFTISEFKHKLQSFMSI